MSKCIDLTGQKFGRLTVIQRMDNAPNGQSRWKCCCECGKEITVRSGNLKDGHTISCGCFFKETIQKANSKHGLTKTRIYRIRFGFLTRCYNKNHKAYEQYGGRGITVCDEWKNDFKAFYEWAMANGYRDNLTLDRINVDGNYEPSNCRWATMKEQLNNTRRNRYITYNGKTQTMKQWAEELEIPYTTLKKRINHSHCNIEKALTTPIQHKTQ